MSSTTKVVLVLFAIPIIGIAGNVMQTVAARVAHAVVVEVVKAMC